MRAFNEQEKDHIRETLIDRGRELFGTLGIKKTSISDLTKAVGIAQGSFYLFYKTKEELFFEILEREEEQIKKVLFSEIQFKPLTKELFKHFLLRSLEVIGNNPIIRRVQHGNEFTLMLRKLPKETIEQHIKKDAVDAFPMLKMWQQQGRLIERDSEVIVGVLRSFVLMSLHKQEIGEDIYDETILLVAESIADKIVKEEH
ncbi:TetR/AcrR family transcriptional regulator [Chengkuizengella axinellae]|uniref:TetR/AcrR family transcriptional regulator n=1 Tax=Chengkuizengella axinellae TaxID=3064388 RepID=A0ABT9IVB5_9BACL|nr:TetR/AcrR family transcriptional regulator [Chengkuizengella sp. 2205SS18-9]MDP5273267.1 TetR/AcrR family transcriptional regulator [Chengkuizengella sp. 2205SS18-9]